MAYKLELPATARVHPVFHVSQLKKAVGDYHSAGNLPVSMGNDVAASTLPEKVLSWRDKIEEWQHV